MGGGPSGRRLGRVPQLPVEPVRRRRAAGVFESAVRFAQETGAAIVHDFAYGDLMFDGRSPESFLATAGAKEVGVEMFSMSKTYGMAGWRLGFVLGNAEIVGRVDLLQDHARAGIFAAVQEAGIAALTGPQDSVQERVARYEARRDRVVEALRSTRVPPPVSEGSFYAWLELPDGVTVERLLAEARVALAPGEGFGATGAGWARLSFAVTDEQLERGLERLVPTAFLDGTTPRQTPPPTTDRAVATMRSRPAALAIRRLTENDPLGGRVMRAPAEDDDAVPPDHDVPAATVAVLVDLELRLDATVVVLGLELPVRSEAGADAGPRHAGVVLGRGDGGKGHADRQKRCEDCELAHFLPPWTTRRTLAPCSQSTGKGLVKRCPSLPAGAARYRYR